MVIAIINRGDQEWQITMTNPFSGIDLKREGKDAKKIEPFSEDELAAIVTACGTSDNQISRVAAIRRLPAHASKRSHGSGSKTSNSMTKFRIFSFANTRPREDAED